MANPDYWIKRWKEGKTGFHQADVNPKIIEYRARFIDENTSRIYLPLCGKSQELQWLANQDLEVVGSDVSSIAFQTFFEEQERPFSIQNGVYTSGNIRLHEADFFKLGRSEIGQFDAIYDRAAMVAIDNARHEAYADRLLKLLVPGGRILLISFNYDPAEMAGPPFSLSDETIRFVFGDAHIELLEQNDILTDEPKFEARGLTWLKESVWLIKART